MESYQYIVIYGNPADGFTYSGPFINHEKAEKWAVSNDMGDTWWIASLESPI